MPNYYYKDAAGQEQGPLPIEELKALNLSPDTLVRDELQSEWKTAEQVDELKSFLAISTTTETIVTEPVIATTVTAASVAPIAAKATAVKSTAWLSWVLSLLVLGGVGYFIYQDIEKNKGNSNAVDSLSMTTSSTDSANAEPLTTADTNASDTTVADVNMADTTTTTVTTANADPTTTTNQTTNTKDKQLLAKQKAEDEKKKQQLTAKQKADEVKKQQIAAQALAAKQLQMRNSWSKYITLGSLNYQPKGDDGMTAFDVPVYNGTDVPLNKVTVRIDYYKKEKKDKIVGSETITLYNIPARSGLNGKAPENKKSRKAVATITSITSRQLNFCYPQGSGNNGDPYFCN